MAKSKRNTNLKYIYAFFSSKHNEIMTKEFGDTYQNHEFWFLETPVVAGTTAEVVSEYQPDV